MGNDTQQPSELAKQLAADFHHISQESGSKQVAQEVLRAAISAGLYGHGGITGPNKWLPLKSYTDED